MASAEGVTGTSAWPIEITITNRPCSSQCSAVRPITRRAGETDGRLHQSEPRCESKQSCPPRECHRHSVMATGLAAQVLCCNMVWEMKSQRGQEGQSQGQAADTTFDLLRCHERSSAHGPLEYDDLPELQEVSFDQSSPHTFPVTPDLSGQDQSQRSWLTELADIATGPQSPLLQSAPQRRSSPVQIFSSSSLHSYARPPLTSSSAPGPGTSRRPRRTRASSESDSGMFWSSSFSDDDDLGWSHSWPSTVWHCFLKGTRVRFHRGQNVEWQEVEDLLESDEESDEDDEGHRQSSSLKSYGAEGLKLVASEETVAFGQSVLKLTFDPGSTEAGLLTAECRPDHPFFMKDKGWASFYPSLTVVQYGIPCYEVQLGDVCLPPGHRDANNCDDSVVFDTFRSFDFTPLDSSAVYVLSSMARQRRASQSSGGTVSPDCDAQEASGHASSGKRGLAQSASSAMTAKCKRPMNAFMLFAKKYRVEYTQMYPGKDNRAISVILGDRWKKMRSEERRMFTAEAKALAEEQKRLNPDCWKRKRTNSGSQQN